MGRLSPKTVAAAGFAAVAVVALVGWFMIVSPPRSRAADLDGQIVDARAELVRAKIAAEASQSDEKLASDYRRLAVAMPEAAELPTAMRELLRAARIAKVRVDSVTTRPLTTKSGYGAVPIEVILTGRFSGIRSFLRNVRTLVGTTGDRVDARGRLFSVDSLEFAPGEDQLPQLTATVRLNAFVYQASASPGSPESANPATSTTASAAGRTS